MKGEAGKAERLFRAAVSAFCSLTRPTRLEITQFEDLALPLFPMVSVEALRFAAAALSDCEYAPVALVRLLSGQPIDIAAPLIMRSPALKDIDLIALIGRHGLAHARVIARRAGLNPAIADLVRALENPKLVRLPTAARPTETARHEVSGTQQPLPGTSAENARRRLRSMMLSPSPAKPGDEKPRLVSTYVRLRDAALTGDSRRFTSALATAIGIASPVPPPAAASGPSTLMALLRYLYLTEERAFLVMAAAFPGKFARAETIRDFLEDYRRIDPVAAETIVGRWKAQSSSAPRQSGPHLKAS